MTTEPMGVSGSRLENMNLVGEMTTFILDTREKHLMEAAEFLIDREFLNVTQEWLAGYLGVTDRTISRWEDGDEIVPESIVDVIVQLKQHTRAEVLDLVQRISKGDLTEIETYQHEADYQKSDPTGPYCASWHRSVVGRAAFISKRNDVVVRYVRKSNSNE